MRTAATNLYRYKGVLAVKGMDRKFVFQGVHMLFSGNFADATWVEGEKRESCFVFIGKNIVKRKKMLTDGFMDCVVDPKEQLRFKKGDLVQAKSKGWKNGKILMTWDDGPTDGAPYLIELEDNPIIEDRTHVWGPFDDDRYVRARPSS